VSVADYLRAARGATADPHAIWSAASANGHSPLELGQLAAALRERHGWKLAKAERHRLIDSLLDAGVARAEIVALAGVDRTTVWRRARSRCCKTGLRDLGIAQGPERPSDAQHQRHIPRGGPTRLGFDASSGADLTLERQRALLARLGAS
jgi:hypothetical protein